MNFFVLLLVTGILLSCKGETKERNKNENKEPLIVKEEIERPSKNVYCGLLDKEGNIWFGTTDDGVYKYDGTKFSHYSIKNGLCNNRVSCIIQAENDDLWFGTADGICIYDGKDFRRLPIPAYETSTDWLRKTYPVVNPNEVQSMVQDKKGGFWIGTNGAGAYRYDGKIFTNYLLEVGNRMPDGLYHNIIQSISIDKEDNIWFTSMSHGGVSKYDGKTFTQYMPKDGLSDDMLRTSFVDDRGMIWFGFNGNRKSGLTYYKEKTFHTFSTKDGLCNPSIHAIYEDKNGALWLGSGRGNLCVFDGENFKEFKSKDGTTFSVVLFILGDLEGNIWFGGKDGLWKYDGELVSNLSK